LKLTAGYQTLKIATVVGSFDFYEMKFVHANNEAVVKTDDFEAGFGSEWNYSDGEWKIESGQAVLNGVGKRTFGSVGWSDYTVEADITYVNAMNAGIIFRVNNPALGGAGNDPGLGSDYLQGYFVTLGSNGVTLGKQNYSWTTLATSPGSYSLNKAYHIKVAALGANIKVYLQDTVAPVVDYTDDNPFMSGKVGLRVHNCHARFDNFSVATFYNPIPEPEPEENEAPEEPVKTEVGEILASRFELFPNPASDELTLRNIQAFSDLAVYSITGQKIYGQQLSGRECVVSTSCFKQGLYVLRLANASGGYVTRMFIKI
jgi:hypothetical protein